MATERRLWDRDYYTTRESDEQRWWILLPPVLPSGDAISEASLIDTRQYENTELVLPVASQGDIPEITSLMWGVFALTHTGREAFESFSIKDLWFSPARSSSGVPLWIARPPLLSNAIDEPKAKAVREGLFPKGHPLESRSGKIRSVRSVVLRRHAIEGHDLFILADYPVFQVISKGLICKIEQSPLSGFCVETLIHPIQISDS